MDWTQLPRAVRRADAPIQRNVQILRARARRRARRGDGLRGNEGRGLSGTHPWRAVRTFDISQSNGEELSGRRIQLGFRSQRRAVRFPTGAWVRAGCERGDSGVPGPVEIAH